MRNENVKESFAALVRDKAVMLCAIVALIAVVALAAWWASGYVSAQTSEQGAKTLRESILDAAVECYAIEGQYPPSIDYLKEHYGISVNGADYTVYYEVFAPNVAPTVEVVVKDE